MRRLLVLGLAAALALTGCRSPRSDLVEAELRTKDRLLREAQGELCFTRQLNQALENTLREQRCSQSPFIKPGCGPSIKDIQLGRGTGGSGDSPSTGDAGIVVMLVPRDCDQSPVKVPGNLNVAAFEISPEGLKSPLSTWTVPAAELRRAWRTGLLSTGYQVTLPFQRVPMFDRIRIVVQFMPVEGGVFEADRDVTIQLSPAAKTCGPPATLIPPSPAPPGTPPTLPPPTPLSPGDPPSLPPPTPLPSTSQYRPATLLPPKASQ